MDQSDKSHQSKIVVKLRQLIRSDVSDDDQEEWSCGGEDDDHGEHPPDSAEEDSSKRHQTVAEDSFQLQ